MKLPDDCPFAKVPLQQFLETEIHRFDCCRGGAAGYFIGTEEPPLCRSRQTEPEAYRWLQKKAMNENRKLAQVVAEFLEQHDGGFAAARPERKRP